MTMAEFVIAAGLLTGLMGTLAIQYVYFARSFARLQNYMYMNGKSRYAVDRMSRDIRQADSITAFTTTNLTILLASNSVTYAFNAAQKTLTRQSAGKTDTYLTDCTYARFDAFQRTTSSNSFALSSATNASSAKVVQIDWVCSKTVAGEPNTAENMQSAIVTIRRK
jgi:hypothetical protein